MAKVEDLKVGQRVMCRNRSGELMTVDRPTGQVVVRFDVASKPAVSSDGVTEAPLGDVTVSALEVSAIDPQAPAKAVGVPTAAQIAAARKTALEAGKKEGLKGDDLEAVQEEAEAELVSRMAKGE